MKTKSPLLAIIALVVSEALVASYSSAQKDPPPPKPAAVKKAAPAPVPPPKPATTKPASTTPPASSAGAAHAAPASSGGHDVVERESRIEFDERLVRGQTAAGAIYLFQRQPSELKSIIKLPDTFRPRTTDLLTSRRASP